MDPHLLSLSIMFKKDTLRIDMDSISKSLEEIGH